MGCCDACSDDACCFINIAGSQTPNRCACDWLADYFGLPTDYKSVICFKPEISNFLVNFSFYLGLDEWVKGLYLKFWGPVVHTIWDLNMCECIIDDGQNNHWPGYFNGNLEGTEPDLYGIKRLHLVSSFTSFIRGCGFINVNDISFTPLHYAKMCCSRQTKTALADFRMAVGWNCICKDSYQVGLNVQTAAPTGNRPEAFCFFEPIVGNGKHWEIGGGVNGRWTFWQNEDETTSGALLIDANITHLMGTKQVRTFDLCGKPFSRYMLAEKLATPISDLQAGPTEQQLDAPNKQFKGIYAPVANFSTFSVDVRIGIQADIVVMLQCIASNFSVDLGYNLWGRTCENIEFRCDCPCPFEENSWGLKGDAFTYGFKAAGDGSITTTAVALSATQSKATICQGTNNWPNGLNGIAWPQNPGIDGKQLAWDANNNPLLIYDVANTTTHQVYTSKNPVLIQFCDIDTKSASTKGMSHKVFAHFDYTWRNHNYWIPYIGIGGEVEFGHNDQGCCNNCCNPCGSLCGNPCSSCCTPVYSSSCSDNRSCCTCCGLSQWGIWLKGGVGFN